MSTTRAIKAYEVHDGEHSVIVFADSAVVARRNGANELGGDFEDMEHCRRITACDQFAEVGRVPAEFLIEECGWWFECTHCGVQISAESEDEDGTPFTPVYVGEAVYCSAQCHDLRLAEKAKQAEQEAAVRKKAEEQWPGIVIVGANGYDKRCYFTFPGGKHSATWKLDTTIVHISNCDQDAWHAFVATLKVAGGAA